jgi:hypothetical protein
MTVLRLRASVFAIAFASSLLSAEAKGPPPKKKAAQGPAIRVERNQKVPNMPVFVFGAAVDASQAKAALTKPGTPMQAYPPPGESAGPRSTRWVVQPRTEEELAQLKPELVDPWRKARPSFKEKLTNSLDSLDWLPAEVRAFITQHVSAGTMPAGATEFEGPAPWGAIVAWYGRPMDWVLSDRETGAGCPSEFGTRKSLELYLEFPDDESFYLKWAKGKEAEAHRLHGAYLAYNREMRALVIEGESACSPPRVMKLSPDAARQRLWATNNATLLAALENYGSMLAAAHGALSAAKGWAPRNTLRSARATRVLGRGMLGKPAPLEDSLIMRTGKDWRTRANRQFGEKMATATRELEDKIKNGDVKSSRQALDFMGPKRGAIAEELKEQGSGFGKWRKPGPESSTPLHAYGARYDVKGVSHLEEGGIHLTGKGAGRLLHTDPKEFAPILKKMDEAFAKLMKAKTPQEIVEAAAEFQWWGSNMMPFERGSGAVIDAITKALLRAKGVESGMAKIGVALDVEAMVTPMSTYIKRYTSLFE